MLGVWESLPASIKAGAQTFDFRSAQTALYRYCQAQGGIVLHEFGAGPRLLAVDKGELRASCERRLDPEASVVTLLAALWAFEGVCQHTLNQPPPSSGLVT